MNPEETNRANRNDAPQRNELDQIKPLLREAMPPVPPDQLELRADLWPQLQARIESQVNNDPAKTKIIRESPSTRIPWFDYALAALAAAALLFFPGIIPALLYHF